MSFVRKILIGILYIICGILEVATAIGCILLVRGCWGYLKDIPKGQNALNVLATLILFICCLVFSIYAFYLIGKLVATKHFGEIEEGIMYEFKNKNGHVEVYLNGVFQFSADTLEEAMSELPCKEC